MRLDAKEMEETLDGAEKEQHQDARKGQRGQAWEGGGAEGREEPAAIAEGQRGCSNCQALQLGYWLP